MRPYGVRAAIAVSRISDPSTDTRATALAARARAQTFPGAPDYRIPVSHVRRARLALAAADLYPAAGPLWIGR